MVEHRGLEIRNRMMNGSVSKFVFGARRLNIDRGTRSSTVAGYSCEKIKTAQTNTTAIDLRDILAETCIDPAHFEGGVHKRDLTFSGEGRYKTYV